MRFMVVMTSIALLALAMSCLIAIKVTAYFFAAQANQKPQPILKRNDVKWEDAGY